MKNKHTYTHSYKLLIRTFLLVGFSHLIHIEVYAQWQNEAPTDIFVSNNNSIQEDLPEDVPLGNRVVGILSAADPNSNEVNEQHTFQKVDGPGDVHNDIFVIRWRDGKQELLVRNTAFLNYELGGLFRYVRIRATDAGGLPFEKSVQIEISDRDDPPTDIHIPSDTIRETNEGFSLVGRMSTYDEDEGASYFYRLSLHNAYPDNQNFTILDNELFIRGAPDFETDQRSYTIHITSSADAPSVHSFPKEFTFLLTDVNEAPTDITLSNDSIDENNIIGTIIGELSTTDEDEGVDIDEHSYELIAGSSFFSIERNILKAAVSFDYEVRTIYHISIRSKDSGMLPVTRNFDIIIGDNPLDNHSPTDINLARRVISENDDPNIMAGILSATDRNPGDTLTFTLNNHQDAFSIEGDTLWTDISFDHEAKRAYHVSITATDQQGGNVTEHFYIHIINSNDPPTDIKLDSSRIFENNQRGDLIGTLSTKDQDEGENHIYSLTNNAGGRFRIVDERLEANRSFNYEEQKWYSISILTTDGFLSYEKQFVVRIMDSNDAPTSIGLLNASIREGNNFGDLVGIPYTTDEDYDDNHTYSLISNPGRKFYIKNNQLLANAVFDFEEEDTYDISIRSEDGNGGSVDQDLTITIISDIDRIGPTLTNFTPLTGTKGINPAKDIFIATFNEPITYGKDPIKVIEIGGDVIISAYPKPGSSLFYIEGSQVFMSFENYAGAFAPGKDYYITISPGAIFDLSGNPLVNPILEKDYSWVFTTGTGNNQANARTVNKTSNPKTENLTTEKGIEAEKGIESLEETVIIYPNPASKFIAISGVESSSIEIIDLWGKVLIESTNKKGIDISGLIQGVYIIQLQDEKGNISTHRFLKRN